MDKKEKEYFETMNYNLSRKQKYDILLHPTDFYSLEKVYRISISENVFTTELFYNNNPLKCICSFIENKWIFLSMNYRKNIEKIDGLVDIIVI